MKTARTISIKVNPRKRRTGKVTRYAANHNRGATAFPPAAPKQSKGASDSRMGRLVRQPPQHDRIWLRSAQGLALYEGTFLFTNRIHFALAVLCHTCRPMNFIRFENHAINVDNVAYVTRSDDNRVVLTFCAAKSESSLHLVLKGAGAEQVWDFFVKGSTATFGKVG